MAEKKTSPLPSIQSLFIESWELFKKTWVSYLKLLGLAIAFVFLGALIGILISLPLSFVAFGSHFQFFKHLTPFNIATFVLVVIWIVLYFLSLIALSVIFPIVSIYILQGKKAASIFDLIKQSKKYFWRYFLVMLLAGLIIFGGVVLFLVPGLVIGLLFAFVAYEIVIDNQSGVKALQRSYVLVMNHFWEVLGRLVLLELIIIVISSLLNKFAYGDALLGFVQLLFSVLAGWYSRSFVYLLFTQLRERTSVPQKISMKWVWIVSGIGWLLIVLFLVALIVGVAHLPGIQPSHVYGHKKAV